eukprot:gnl/MRDRNA2_/MRDRNA2_18493_c0_seq1.p1 gnl/MRDRNA2_/MRDRNA2_18493_c0~~gnl/MRDRNA2_/MRDRNA2_18493_c0_seq1.p1  ORF type:complete len:218 (+),score=32.15 gnl/MRDRNA2_/MRDRNA2_18493_c0_seq1:51-704(+)
MPHASSSSSLSSHSKDVGTSCTQQSQVSAIDFVFSGAATRAAANDFVFVGTDEAKDKQERRLISDCREHRCSDSSNSKHSGTSWTRTKTAATVKTVTATAAAASTVAAEVASQLGTQANDAADKMQKGWSNLVRRASTAVGGPVKSKRPQHVCVVCLEEVQRLVILAPCGHQVLCGSCARRLHNVNPEGLVQSTVQTQGNCPVCKTRIDSVIKRVFK